MMIAYAILRRFAKSKQRHKVILTDKTFADRYIDTIFATQNGSFLFIKFFFTECSACANSKFRRTHFESLIKTKGFLIFYYSPEVA